MPLIARRGSVSSRAYGQLRRSALPTVTTYSGGFRFDNNNDVSLFFFTKSTRLTVSPFTTLSTIYKSATTNDLDTWTTYNGFVSPAINSYFPWWGTGKYHVPDSSYRQWIQTYYDPTVDVTTDPGNVFTQNVSTDGLATWTRVTNNLISFVDVKTPTVLNGKSQATIPVLYGDDIFRNLGSFSQFSNVGPFGPYIVLSSDAGTTYTKIFDATSRVLPMTSPLATSTSGPKFGNSLPYLSWSGSFNNYSRPPVGIWATTRNLLEADKDYYVGSGGSLYSNGGAMGKRTYTLNPALRDRIGKYTWLYSVFARGQRIGVAGWGCLPEDYATGTQRNFSAVSNDGGTTWTVCDLVGVNALDTLYTQKWTSPFNNFYFIYHTAAAGGRWILSAATVGAGTTNTALSIAFSGAAWVFDTNMPAAGLSINSVAVAEKNTGLILLAYNNGQVVSSTDQGGSWSIAGNINQNVIGMIWAANKFVAVTNNSESFVSTSDGAIWNSTGSNWRTASGVSALAPASVWSKVSMVSTTGGDVYTLVQNQRVLKSTDGLTWTTVGLNSLETLMNDIGRSVRVLTLYENSATDYDLIATGDWGTQMICNSVDGGANWGNWTEVTNLWSNEMAPPVNGPTGFQPVMTPLINSSLTITAGGSGYTSGKVNVRFSKPDSPQGWEPIISTITVTAGAISAISLLDSGAGYTSPPTVTITDAAGVGAGATATCSFVNSTATPAVQMKRIMYWDYAKASSLDAKSVGAGWYGTNPTVGIAGTGLSGNLVYTGAVLKSSADVSDATSAYTVTLNSGTTNASFQISLTAETDTPGIMHTSPFTYTGGYNSGDGAARRTFFGDYMDYTNWGWTKPIGGAADVYGTSSTSILSGYIAGKAFIRPGFFPIYDSTIAPSIAGATPGVAWYVTGYTVQSLNDSTGASKIVYNPAVKKYAFLPATGEWQLLADGEMPTGSWTFTLDSTNMQNSPGFGGSPLQIVSNGTDPSNKATTVIAWTSFYRPFNNFSISAVGPLAFITTDGGVTWANHTALLDWMTANGYLNLTSLQWNQNEGKWVMLMTKITIFGNQIVPPDTVITADFVTYVVKPNADTVNIPTT